MNFVEECKLLEQQGRFADLLEFSSQNNEIEGIYYRIRSLERLNRPDEALKLINKYKEQFDAIKEEDKVLYAWYLHNFGTILFLRGELDNAYDLYLDVEKIRDEENQQKDQVLTYSNLGEILRFRGDYKQSLEFFQKARKGAASHEMLSVEAFANYSIIQILLLQDRKQEAKDGFKDLQELYNANKNTEDPYLTYSYKFSKALILKFSKRLKNKMKAIEILEEILEHLDFYSHMIYEVIISLVDLLFLEYKSLEEDEILEDILEYISFLEEKSLENQMYMIYLNSQILRANVYVMVGDLTMANSILEAIESLAEEKNLKIYQSKIKSHQDALVDQIKTYELFLENNASLQDKFENTEMQKYINFLLTKREKIL